jgi:predicted DNA-binding transcriptional regulator AlpA
MVCGASLAILSSRDVLNKSAIWCGKQLLFVPSDHEIADAMRMAGHEAHKSNGQRLWRGAKWRVDDDPLVALSEPDIVRRFNKTTPVFPRRVFCELTGVGRSTLYALSARGEAPNSYRRGRRVFITAIDAVGWCAARDRHAAVLCIVGWVEDRRASVSRVKDRVTAWTSAGM